MGLPGTMIGVCGICLATANESPRQRFTPRDTARRLTFKPLIAPFVATVLGLVAQAAFAQVEKPGLKFSQGWLFQATQAQFPLAADKGYWKSEGLER